MFEGIMALLGSSAIGSLIGGIFAFINRRADIEAKRVDYAHEQARWGHDLTVKDKDLEYARIEAQGKMAVAVEEGNALVDAARAKAIADITVAERITPEEIKAAGKWGFLLVWANVFNKAIRPVLTVALAAAALWLNWLVIHMMTRNWAEFSTDTQFQIGMQAFSWVTAQASMAFAYWFVSRGTGK